MEVVAKVEIVMTADLKVRANFGGAHPALIAWALDEAKRLLRDAAYETPAGPRIEVPGAGLVNRLNGKT